MGQGDQGKGAAPAGQGAAREQPEARPGDRASATDGHVTEGEVRALLAAWLGAQNRGDLVAYLALYAERFTGVKRVLHRTWRYDRKGWAADRGRMFRSKMTVEAKDASVSGHARLAILRFHQIWASGDFKDEGTKQLVVVREGTALRIAREEMLSSAVLAAPAPRGIGTPDLTGGRFLMVAPVTAGGALHVILDHRPSARWAKPGHLAIMRRGLVLRDVDEAQLPQDLKAFKGKRLKIYAAGKPSCEVAVQGFALMADVVPHFGTQQEWEGQRDGRKRTDAEVAAAIWDLATRRGTQTLRGPGLWLVARLDRDRKACPGGAAWARDAALGPPVLWRRAPAAPLVAKAVASLRALGPWARLQQEFRQEQPKGLWDEHEGAKVRVDVFGHPTDGRRVVVASARAGDGCGRFEGQLWAAWEVQGKTWTRLTRAETDRHFQVGEVFGAAGDGQPQLLDPFALVVRSGKLYQVRLTYEPPFYDCGC